MNSNNKKIWWPIVIIVVSLLVIMGVWRYQKMNNKSEAEILKNKISHFMLLPDEIPTIATIIDKDRLSGQDFFKKSQNGDKLLIFSTANLAILYRPSINKIIDKTASFGVGDLNVEITPTAIPTTIKNDYKIKLAIYNGSQKAGLAAKLQTEILDKIDNFQVIAKKDAKNNYEKSLVIDISGNYSEVAKSLAQSIGGETAPLPEGEAKVETDLLVIIGKNWE